MTSFWQPGFWAAGFWATGFWGSEEGAYARAPRGHGVIVRAGFGTLALRQGSGMIKLRLPPSEISNGMRRAPAVGVRRTAIKSGAAYSVANARVMCAAGTMRVSLGCAEDRTNEAFPTVCVRTERK